MEHSWSQSDKILMMIGEYAIATFKKGSHYYLFDSHSRNTLGHIAQENGTSILMKFDSNVFLINYLKEVIQWLCTETHSTIECLPVTITRDWYQLQAYFNDQAARSNKTEYNRLYKQKQRTNPTFQAKENKRQVTYMRNRRENRKFRNKEKSLDCMYKLTIDAELRQKVNSQKVAYMQTKRTDSKFRGLEKIKDAAYKQTRRTDPELRAKDKHKDAAYKQTRRANAELRSKEKIQNVIYLKTKRSNPEFRTAEKEKRKNLTKKQKLSEHDAKCTKENPLEQKFDNAPSNKCNEISAKHAQKYGQNLTECVSHFHDTIAIGPTFVCTCCHQTWFSHSVVEVNRKLSSVSIELKNKYFTGKVSEKNREWLCRTCLVQLKQCKIPKLAVANGLSFPTKPPELCLYALEEGRCYVPGYRPHSGLANVACPGPRAHSGPVNVACPGRPTTQWPVERCVPGCPGARPRSGQCVPGPSATFVISLTQRQGNLALVSCNTFGWWNVPSVPWIPLNYVIVNGAFLSNGSNVNNGFNFAFSSYLLISNAMHTNWCTGMKVVKNMIFWMSI